MTSAQKKELERIRQENFYSKWEALGVMIGAARSTLSSVAESGASVHRIALATAELTLLLAEITERPTP